MQEGLAALRADSNLPQEPRWRRCWPTRTGRSHRFILDVLVTSRYAEFWQKRTFDYAMVESFFATPKQDLVHLGAWLTRHELEMEVFSCIESLYNPNCRHGRPANLNPAAYEESSSMSRRRGTKCPPDEGHFSRPG